MIDFTQIDVHRDSDLRPYQKENKAKIYKFWESGRSVMLQMPTGTGKTRVFASIARDMHEWGVANKKAVKILFLAHRKELIDQISETLGVKYNLANGIIAAGFHEQRKVPIQVGSVPTLNRRLDRWVEKDFDIIVIDEAHHTPAESYKKILKEFPNSKILGVTATPYRLSGAGFKDVFEDIVISDSVAKFIDSNWLSDYEYFSIKPDSLAQKNIEALQLGFDGDYLESDMENRLDRDHIRAKIIETYLRYANGKKGLVYSINQKHNIHLCAQFEEQGISARAIDSKTSKEERQQIVQDFKNGKFDVLCNVNIFSEGFDCPDVEFIQLARPTKSLSMYLQQVGRGLRTHEDKEKVIFLDNVGLYNRFGLPSANRKWRYHFEGRKDAQESDVVKWNLTGERQEVQWIEGEEQLDMVYSTIDTNYTVLSDYPIVKFDILPDSFMIGDINDQDDMIEIIKTFDTDIAVQINDYKYVVEKDKSMMTRILGPQTYYTCYQLIYNNSHIGIYNKQDNRVVFGCVFDEIERTNITGQARVRIGKKYGVIDVINGAQILPVEFDDIEFVQDENLKTLFITLKDGGVGIIDTANSKRTEFKYDEIFYAKTINHDGFFNACTKSGEWHIIYGDLNIISTFQVSHARRCLLEGKLYLYKRRGYYGISNNKEQLLTPIYFDEINICTKSDRIIANKKLGVSALYDYNINLIGDRYYSSVCEVSKNIFCVDDGCINANGEYIIKQTMHNPSQHMEHILFVDENKHWCAIDFNGKLIDGKFLKKNKLIEFLYPPKDVASETNTTLEPWQDALLEYKSQLPPPISKRQQKMIDRAERRRIEAQEHTKAQKVKQEKQETEKQALALKYATYAYNNYNVSYSKSDKLWIATNNSGSSYFGESKEEVEKLINQK